MQRITLRHKEEQNDRRKDILAVSRVYKLNLMGWDGREEMRGITCPNIESFE